MSPTLDRRELEQLFQNLRNGTLTDPQQNRLEFLLHTQPEARKLWFLHCDLETGLADWAATRDAQQTKPTFTVLATPSLRERLVRWTVPLAAAAVILISVAGWLQFRKDANRGTPVTAEATVNGVAVLTRAPGVEWADGAERSPGAILGAGTLQLKSGAALIEFFSGARVVVEGPAEFRLVSANGGFLQAGKVHAHIPPQARGFAIDSPGMRVIDHGTDFAVSVLPNAAPEVHVFEGRVDVSIPQMPPRALQKGAAVRLEGSVLRDIPAVAAHFITEEEITRRDDVHGRQRQQVWQQSTELFRKDPAAGIYYTFSPDESPERTVSNQVPGAALESHGSIVGSTWTDGRWPGKRALDFRSESDRVRFTAPPLGQAVTLLTWVRVKSLPRWQNVLLASDSHEPGALRWHVTQNGELRLEIARDLGRPHADWEAVNSTRFLTPERSGQWVFLATTFDGSTVRHYGNGQPIGTGASFTPPALVVGQAELGNWRGDTQRQFTGGMDEFALLSRVLSPAEIRALFEAGKP